jgi:chromosomal replication initiation ATPase DnaA
MSLLQYILNFSRRGLNEDDFILGDHNIDTYNYVRQFPDWPNKIIFISGPEGSGKKHISEYWNKSSEATKIELFNETEKKLNQLLESNNCFILENIDIYFTRKFILRNLDNHDFKCFEKTIFSILDHVINENKYLFITSKEAPNELNIKLADLKSRILSVASLKVTLPNENALKTFLIREFSNRQLKINNDICEYILKHSKRSFDDLEALVNKIDTLSLHKKRNITKPFIKEVLENDPG